MATMSTTLDRSSETSQPPTQPQDDSASQAPSDEAPTEAPKAGPSLCGVCNLNPSKYKCPRCYLPYCSVACNKTHRENHPPDPEPKPKPKPAVETTSNTQTKPDPNNPFSPLENSDKLKLLFQKYPGLPDQLLQIHEATLPPPNSASQNPGIPASLLKGLPKKETWTHDIGIQNGKEALRKARKAEGEAGEAIREYSELILHLLDTETSNADMSALLQQQVVQEDSKWIERLMAEEKR